jgi:hypothetical protein
MPTIDTRPGKVDLRIHPGNFATYRLHWPTDLEVAGRTFTGDVDGTPLDVTVDGNDVIVAFSDTITAGLVGRPHWSLTETTANDQVRVTGRVLPSSSGTETQDETVTVTVDEVLVQVTVLGEPGTSGPGGGGSAMTAAEVLAAVKTVDGTGSGLDADLLDGHDTGHFATAAGLAQELTDRATADALALPKAGGTMTGAIVLPGNAAAALQAAPLQQVQALIADAVALLLGGAPAAALDTIAELATLLAADDSALAALTTVVSGKLSKASNLSDLTDVAAARLNLALRPGVEVQAYDATLAALAALTTAANKLIYATGVDAFATSDLTANALTLLGHTFTQMRTDLGLGSAALVDTGTTSGTIPLLSTGGVLPIARLATGTPDGTKFVKDDGTLAVPAGGSSTFPLDRTAAVKTSAYTAAVGELVPCDTTAGAFTVTLPTAPADRSLVVVKHILQGGTNVVTVACGGADTINRAAGSTTTTLPLLGHSLFFQYDSGSAVWTIVADDTPISQLDLRYLALTGGTLSGALAMGSNKVTGLAAGTTAGDAVRFQQVGRILAEAHADMQVVNTVTETDLFSYSLPGGTLAAGDSLALMVDLSWLNNSAGSVTFRWRLKFGATTLFDSAATTFTTSASRNRGKFLIDIIAGSTTAQIVDGLIVGTRGASPGVIITSGTGLTAGDLKGTGAEDTSTAKTLKLTIEHGTAAATVDTTLHSAKLLLQKVA